MSEEQAPTGEEEEQEGAVAEKKPKKKPKRTSISWQQMDEECLDKIDAYCELMGISRSRFSQDAANFTIQVIEVTMASANPITAVNILKLAAQLRAASQDAGLPIALAKLKREEIVAPRRTRKWRGEYQSEPQRGQ